MSAGKSSRNAQRKVAYAGLADKASRNQNTIDQKYCPACVGVRGRACTLCQGTGSVSADFRTAEVPTTAIDVTTGHVVTRAAIPKRESSAEKLRRQESAWARCRAFLDGGDHDWGGARRNREATLKISYPRDNCAGCGCPKDR